MRFEEITADIPEEKAPEETAVEETTAEETATEEAATEETVTEETTAEETATEEAATEETVTEGETPEETTQEETAAEKETIQDREEIPETSSWKEEMTEYTDTAPAPDLEYDVFEQILAEQQAANTLLVRITNQNDLFLGIGVALIICCVCYSVLERFTRF